MITRKNKAIEHLFCYNIIKYIYDKKNHAPSVLSLEEDTALSIPLAKNRIHPVSFDIFLDSLSKLLLGKRYLYSTILIIFLIPLNLSAESKEIKPEQNVKNIKKEENNKKSKAPLVNKKNAPVKNTDGGKEEAIIKTKEAGKPGGMEIKKSGKIVKDDASDEEISEEEKKIFEKEKKKADRIENIINHGTHKERKEAINIILTIKNKEIKERLGKKLVELINNEIDSDVKVKSITVAGEMKIHNALTGLQNSLNDESEDVKIAAVYAIKRIGDRNVTPILISKLKEQKLEENSNFIESLIDTLGEFNAVELCEYAINAIKDEQTTKNIREQLILFLGRIDSKKSKDFLIGVLKDEEEEKGIRAFAANSLAKLGIKEAANDIDDIVKIIESYTFKKKKKYYNLYIYCLAALAKLGDERAVPRLINSLRSDNAVVRLKAIRLIKELKDKRTIDILRYKMLYDQSRTVQSAAKKALKELGVDTDEKQETDKKENDKKNNSIKADARENSEGKETIKKVTIKEEKEKKSDVQK